MHVVHCLGSAGRTGGMEYGVIKLVNGSDRSRVRSAVCSTRPADPAIRALLDPDIEYVEGGGRPGNDPRLVLSLRRIFREFDADIVHTHAWGTLVEGVVGAWLARVPRIVHGEHGTLQRRQYQLRIQRFFWGHVDQVLSVSSLLAARIAGDVGFDPERILTIRNGVDTERFTPARRTEARRRLGLDSPSVAIGTVGRLVDVKDHELLLHAFAALPVTDRRPAPTLVIAGDGPLGVRLRARAHGLGIDTRVRFLGHRPDVEDVLAAIDLFVLSSKSEGLSNTILEAMASGVPVIATRVGGAEELVVNDVTGYLVAPGDVTNLSSAMRSLIDDPPVRARMAAAARERAVATFGLERMVSEYTDFYEGLVGARTSPAWGAAGDCALATVEVTASGAQRAESHR